MNKLNLKYIKLFYNIIYIKIQFNIYIALCSWRDSGLVFLRATVHFFIILLLLYLCTPARVVELVDTYV
jgi:hypothetical protein